jgi:ribosomal protein S18 acetylase RimI-like enzyme
MVSVRPFEQQDAQPLADLMLEMIQFYGATVDPTLLVADDVVRQSETIDIIVAQGDGELLGFATFTSLYPVAGLISFTYAQQIYVSAKARRMGVAQRLIAEIARIATATGSTRIEWSTGKENTAARALYDGLGAIGSDKVQYVLEGDALYQLAASAGFTGSSAA